MFQFRLPQLPSFSSFSLSGGVGLPKSQVHDIQDKSDKRARTVDNLIKHNHITHSLLPASQRPNNVVSALGAAYIIGADAAQLNQIYEVETNQAEAWQASPGEISQEDWRDFLGQKEYQRAFVDFFEDRLVQFGYDWHALLDEFLLSGKDPLIHALTSGLARPLIQLGYAHELSSRTAAIEALALAACYHDAIHASLVSQTTSPTPTALNESVFAILQQVTMDATFARSDSVVAYDFPSLLKDVRARTSVLIHCNALDLKKPKEQFADCQKLAVTFLVAAPGHGQGGSRHSALAANVLASSHATRVLLPLLPANWQSSMIRQWWFFSLLAYIAQARPGLQVDAIEDVKLNGDDWTYVQKAAIAGEHREDTNYVQVVRAIIEAGKTWGDKDQFYLKAAVKFIREFRAWS